MSRKVSQAIMILFVLTSMMGFSGQAVTGQAQSSSDYYGLIVFIRDGDIWSAAPDGSNPQQLTHIGSLSEPVFSPDGKRIAYVHHFLTKDTQSDAFEIGLYHFDTHLTQVIIPARKTPFLLLDTYYWYLNPRWSPDGQSIYYIDWDGRVQGYRVHKYNLATHSTDSGFSPFFAHDIDVSRVDGRIVYTDYSNSLPITGDYLKIANSNGSGQTILVPLSESNVINYPRWSPDGLNIVFTGHIAPNNQNSITVINHLNTVQTVYPLNAGNLAWSPDGTEIVYGENNEIRILNLSTHDTRSVTPGIEPYWAFLQGSSISGRVTESNLGLAGVTISDAYGHSTTTGADGTYTLNGLPAGPYTLTASKDGYNFARTPRTALPIVTVPPDRANINFLAYKIPIILLPGIMGTRLSNAPVCIFSPLGSNVWPNVPGLANFVLYNISLKTLFLDPDGIHPKSECDRIYPDGRADQGAEGLVIDVYKGFITLLQKEGFSVLPYPGYDWRLDLEDSAQKLDKYISDDLKGYNLTSGKVILIGHSMGGLVAKQYISVSGRAIKVDKIISVGSPYWGAPVLSERMLTGNTGLDFDLLMEDNIIKDIIRNSPGAMQLLPSPHYFDYGWYYRTGDNLLQTYVETSEYFAGHGQNGDLLQLAGIRHTTIDDFSQLSGVPENFKYYIFTANHKKTPSLYDEKSCWYGTCPKPIGYLPGDGTVTWFSARLAGVHDVYRGDPNKVRVCTFSAGNVRNDHGSLLADLFVINDVVHILKGENPVYCTYDAAQISQSPVLVTGYDTFSEILVEGSSHVMVSDFEWASYWGQYRPKDRQRYPRFHLRAHQPWGIPHDPFNGSIHTHNSAGRFPPYPGRGDQLLCANGG